MGFSTRINDVAAKELLAAARAVTPKAFAPEFAELGRVYRDLVILGFMNETDPYGNAWAHLAKSTISRKKKAGYGNALILEETGLLMNSFKYRVLTNGVRLFSDRVFDDGTDASIHQTGGIHPVSGKPIPPRPMLPDHGDFPSEWLAEAERVLGDGIDRLFA